MKDLEIWRLGHCRYCGELSNAPLQGWRAIDIKDGSRCQLSPFLPYLLSRGSFPHSDTVYGRKAEPILYFLKGSVETYISFWCYLTLHLPASAYATKEGCQHSWTKPPICILVFNSETGFGWTQPEADVLLILQLVFVNLHVGAGK